MRMPLTFGFTESAFTIAGISARSRSTGRPARSLDRYTVVDDIGTVINPLLAKGQIQGGVARRGASALPRTSSTPTAASC